MSRSDPQLPDADADRTVAAIDLGTQTALLTIVRFDDRGVLDVVEDHAFAARLGSGLSHDKLLAPESKERTLAVLQTFARRIDLHGVPPERVRAVGTAVLRRARDANEFVEQVKSTCGFTIEIVDGTEEARLAWLGATESAQVSAHTEFDALVDVGGGSAELVGPGGAFIASLELGAAWLTERFATTPATGAFTAEAWTALESHVEQELAALPPVEAQHPVLVGGGAVNLGCLARGAAAFDHRVAEGVLVAPDEVLGIARRMCELDLEERFDLPIEPDRAAALPAGLFVIGALLRAIGGRRAAVTGRGLRHGVALELVRQTLATR